MENIFRFYHLSLTIFKAAINFSESSGEILLRGRNLILVCNKSFHHQKKKIFFSFLLQMLKNVKAEALSCLLNTHQMLMFQWHMIYM